MDGMNDRLSNLPDDLIHKILSFISTKHVVQTSALSSRWRFLWTSMPYIDISTDDMYSKYPYEKLSQFVNGLLFGRNGHIEVYSVKLTFKDQTFDDSLLKRILNYAFSHNVQQLTVTCLLCEAFDFPLDLFRSRSLKYLMLTGCYSSVLYLEPTWELPALTTLHLDYVAFYEDSFFSKCANLKNLTLDEFDISGSHSSSFTLYLPRLSNLTLVNDSYFAPKVVDVVAPQLENLTIKSCFDEFLINAPNLISLLFEYGYQFDFSTDLPSLDFSTDLPSLEKVDLCISSTNAWSGCRVAALLQKLSNVKFFTLNLEFAESLISDMEGISLQPSPFSNLKSLKMYPVNVPADDEADKKVVVSSKVLNYLLDASPSATFTLISYEEIKEKQQKIKETANAAAAQNLMENLRVVLEKKKANIENNITGRLPLSLHHLTLEEEDEKEENETDDQGTAPVERMQLQLKRKMVQIKRFSVDVVVQIDQGKQDTRYIISHLRAIEVALLEDLPASKRDELQACFSSLCVEVDTVVKKIFQHMMTPHSNLSDCLNELATVSLLSS